MAQRVEIRKVTCPANTAQTAAIETDMSFDPGTMVEIEVVIPAGHAGDTGLAIAQAHQIVIPATGDVWIIGDDDVLRWPVQDYLNSGSWSAFTYNVDNTYDHSWYFRLLIDELPLPAPPLVPTPLTQAAILTAGT